MWTVTLSSLEQCAKTYEIRRTPTPVRVTEALQAAVLEGVARPARARAGLLLAWDLKYRSSPHHNRRGAAPGGHPGGWGACARAGPTYRTGVGKGLMLSKFGENFLNRLRRAWILLSFAQFAAKISVSATGKSNPFSFVIKKIAI